MVRLVRPLAPDSLVTEYFTRNSGGVDLILQ